MANNPIIKIKRGATAPATGALAQGEFAVDQVSKNLYLGISDGNGGTINEIVGGSGTFATKQFVTDAVSAGTGSLGTMSTQNADAVAITGGAIDGTAIGATTPSTGAFTTLTASEAPTNSTDVVRKTDLDSAISALGSVFHYAGQLSSYQSNLDAYPAQQVGAYYQVAEAGTYGSGTTIFPAKVGDAFVKTTDGWQKLDNVDAEVFGTANEIVVTGDENAGYAVALAEEFKTRVSDVESKTQNIDPSTSAGSTIVNGQFSLRGDGINNAFSITPIGEVSIGAPGQDIYLDRPTYVTGDLSVNGNITDATIDGGEY